MRIDSKKGFKMLYENVKRGTQVQAFGFEGQFFNKHLEGLYGIILDRVYSNFYVEFTRADGGKFQRMVPKKHLKVVRYAN